MLTYEMGKKELEKIVYGPKKSVATLEIQEVCEVTKTDTWIVKVDESKYENTREAVEVEFSTEMWKQDN
jgi:hypothetical protein